MPSAMPSPPPSGFVQRTTADEFSLRPEIPGSMLRSLAPRALGARVSSEKTQEPRSTKKIRGTRDSRFAIPGDLGDANVRNISPFTISSVPPQVVSAACTTRDDMAIDGMVGEMTAEEALLAVLMVTANTQTIVTAYLLHRRRKRQRLEPYLFTRGGAAPGRKRASPVAGNKRKARDAGVVDSATGDNFYIGGVLCWSETRYRPTSS